MTATEYDRLCYTHVWKWRDDSDTLQELELINEAREHGDTFKHIFNTHHVTAWGVPFFKFPVATPANEQHTNTTTMNINTTVTISFDEKAEAVLNKLAEALFMNGTRGDPVDAPVREALREAPPVPANEEAPTPEAPKKRKAKAADPTPEPEPLDVPTGPELKERITPLKDTSYTQKLRDYMDGPLNLKGTVLRLVTDVDALKKIDAKITELLKEAADADGNAADDV